MIPTTRQLALWVGPLGISLGALFLPSWAWAVLGLDLCILALCVLDALFTRLHVDVEREVQPLQSVGRPFSVNLYLHNRTNRQVQLSLTDSAPGEVTGLPTSVRLDAAGRTDLSYPCTVEVRGQHAFGPVTLRATSPLGLWQRQRRVQVDTTLRVVPDFAAMRTWSVDAKLQEQRAPLRVRRRSGGENEFERLRPYVPGDPYRHIDWRATARKGEFVSREFGQESNQNVIFLLDSGRMMSALHGERTAFDHALTASVVMGQTALRRGDRVGLLAFDSEVRAWLPPQGGARTGGRLIRGTYDLFPSLAEPDYSLAMRWLGTRVRRRSLVVLLTALVDEPSKAMAEAIVSAMAKRHLVLVVWMRDPDLVRLTEAPGIDGYERGAAADLLAWRDTALTQLRRKGAHVIDAPSAGISPALLASYLDIKARRLL